MSSFVRRLSEAELDGVRWHTGESVRSHGVNRYKFVGQKVEGRWVMVRGSFLPFLQRRES
jgi:hypothetical protein